MIAGRPLVYRRSIVACEAEVAWRPRVVLVHGLGLCGHYMLPLAARLADTYRVFLPDLPGFGDSSHPHEVLDVAGLADALAAWLDAMDLPRVALLGNSFGCQIIVDLAARHPDRLERAILQGPTAPPEERSSSRRSAGSRTRSSTRPRSVP